MRPYIVIVPIDIFGGLCSDCGNIVSSSYGLEADYYDTLPYFYCDFCMKYPIICTNKTCMTDISFKDGLEIVREYYPEKEVEFITLYNETKDENENVEIYKCYKLELSERKSVPDTDSVSFKGKCENCGEENSGKIWWD